VRLVGVPDGQRRGAVMAGVGVLGPEPVHSGCFAEDLRRCQHSHPGIAISAGAWTLMRSVSSAVSWFLDGDHPVTRLRRTGGISDAARTSCARTLRRHRRLLLGEREFPACREPARGLRHAGAHARPRDTDQLHALAPCARAQRREAAAIRPGWLPVRCAGACPGCAHGTTEAFQVAGFRCAWSPIRFAPRLLPAVVGRSIIASDLYRHHSHSRIACLQCKRSPADCTEWSRPCLTCGFADWLE